ncbi:T-cell immunoreceptor with Ig and ITIM domains-like isoform X4 [Brienomyrus brachyistius]|uniref:T-cell immunoreceptor with Ig and ITIM domains-like isoform X4 n=1 Tax=Brienomyrus brachyistius TaxID=42636 RepID=UPI0020B3D614|nr:T-cell immunoreceptor with Ig and ITIM domains-like isoform X4 [Brienomyrus brachyistius]
MGLIQVLLSLVLTRLPLYTTGNVPHIITDSHVNADLDGDFTLNCRLSLSNTNVSQVQWLWRSSEKPGELIVVFHKEFGINYRSTKFRGRVTFFSHSQHHVSIRVSDVMMNDTGNYTCRYTTFPRGILQATITVTVTEPPQGGSLWILGTVMAALLFTVLLAAAVYFTLKHAQKATGARSRKSQPHHFVATNTLVEKSKSLSFCLTHSIPGSDQTTNDQDQDLNYAEIGFFKKASGTKVPQSKSDVEYGEVVFPSDASRAHSPSGRPNAHSDTTYAEVKRA